MPSPFPGMDPYLEDQSLWPDFHRQFLIELQEQVADQLPSMLVAELESRSSLAPLDRKTLDERLSAETTAEPDVGSDVGGSSLATTSASNRLWQTATISEPPTTARLTHNRRTATPGHRQDGNGLRHGKRDVACLHVTPQSRLLVEPFVEVTEPRLVVRRAGDRRIVAVLDLFTPHTKCEPGRLQYLAQRRNLLREQVHLVELDLLIGGEPMPLTGVGPWAHYFALITDAQQYPECDVYSWTLRDSMPSIPLPLRPGGSSILLNLTAAFQSCYDRGNYRASINYDMPPMAFSQEHWQQCGADLLSQSIQPESGSGPHA